MEDSSGSDGARYKRKWEETGVKVKVSIGIGSSKKQKKIYPAEQQNLTPRQYLILTKCLEGHSIAMHGSAGSGKTYLLSRISAELQERGYEVAITASTGIAALKLDMGATTLHSFTGAGLCNGFLTEDINAVKRNVKAKNRWRKTDVLIVDEISMVSPYFFFKVDQIAKAVRKNTSPFGGLQVIICGDWAQLEPVNRDDMPAPYDSMTYCFETDTWKNLYKDENIIILDTIFRQGKDPDFIKILQGIREGRISKRYLDMLKDRVGAKLHPPDGIRATKLYPTNEHVDAENERELEKLEGEAMEYEWVEKVEGVGNGDAKFGLDTLRKRVPIDKFITLKKGAMVVLVVNQRSEEGFVNGLQGVVTGFEPSTDLPIIKFVNGQEITVGPYTWNHSMGNNTYTKKRNGATSNREFVGVRIKQLPLRLAFALTIHKSQSMTLEYVEADLGPDNFAAGQAYTAISRATRLSGLTLTKFSKKSIIINPIVKDFYRKYTALCDANLQPSFLPILKKDKMVELEAVETTEQELEDEEALADKALAEEALIDEEPRSKKRKCDESRSEGAV